MKKLICLLLALAMLLSLAACGSPNTDAEEEDEEEYTERSERRQRRDRESEPSDTPAPDEDDWDGAPLLPDFVPAQPTPAPVRQKLDPFGLPESMLTFLNRFSWYSFKDGRFDSSELDDEHYLMGFTFRLALDYDSYPGPAADSSGSDPRGLWYGCYIYDADKTDWILRNICHHSPADIENMRDAANRDSLDYYYQDGHYYVMAGGVGGGYNCLPCYASFDGSRYYVTCAVYAGDGYTELTGFNYAELALEQIDGVDYWTVYRWQARALDSGTEPIPQSYAGEWTLDGEDYSSLSIDSDGSIYAVFYRIAAFPAQTIAMDDGTVVFRATDESGFSGWIDLEQDELSMHVYSMPDDWGQQSFAGGHFVGRTFVFHRGTPESAAETVGSFSISADELEAQIEFIRDCYYNPGSADQKITVSNGTDGWNYSREYYYHNGELIFAFIFNGTEEHRLYFLDGHMIRYIDENRITYDYPELDAWQNWAERALNEALTMIA